MNKKILSTLRVGDTVRIHFTHMGSRPNDARGRPFDVVIAKFNDTGRAYKEDDGRYYESRQISWRWADLPVELQPEDSVRDDVRGLDTAHMDHIVAIVARAPYRVQPQPRNRLYAEEQEGFLDHQKIAAYRAAKGERDGGFGRLSRQATGYRYEAYNETWRRDIKPGQYNGHVFNLAKTLIARRSQLAVSDHLDPDRFYAAWEQAGRPGYVSAFVPMTSFSVWDDDKDEKKPSPLKALVNRKAFTNWVVRNAPRFVMTKAQQLKNMIQSAIDEEEFYRKSMEDDYRRDYGGSEDDYSDAGFPEESEDPQEVISAGQAARDLMQADENVGN